MIRKLLQYLCDIVVNLVIIVVGLLFLGLIFGFFYAFYTEYIA